MRVLIVAGAHVEAADSIEQRPLHQAAWNDALAAAKVPIEAGADVNIGGVLREVPLHCAAKDGNLK